MKLSDLLEQAKTMPPEEFKEKMQVVIQSMSHEERRELAAALCGGVKIIAQQFVPAVIDHIVETGHPFGQQAKDETQDLMKRLTR